MGNKRLYLVDATAFCYRAFYALGGLSTSFGQPTNAIYGFLNILHKLLKEKKPEYLAICFDVSRDTFRQKKFAEYKIQRPPMPDGLSSQIPLIKEVILAYGMTIFEKQGYEADDIIATLAKRAEAKGLSVTVVSSDKDVLQLVDDNTEVFSPYKDAGVVYDAAKVAERFGVGPEKMTDLVALMGDDVDNIPGVPGIGEKTAVELIKNFGSLEKLLKHVDEISPRKLQETIRDNIEKIKLNHELAVLDSGVDLDFDLEKLEVGEPNTQELFRLFKYLEFKRFLKALPLAQGPWPEEKVEVEGLEDSALKDMRGVNDTLVLSGSSPEEAVFYTEDKFFRVGKIGANLKSILAEPKIKKIGHDLKKMKLSFGKEGLDLNGLYFDTMIAAYLLDPAKAGYTLVDLAWDYLGEAIKMEQVDAQKAIGLILRLRPKLESELKEKKLIDLFHNLEMPLVGVLADIQMHGIKLDIKLLGELSRDIQKRLVKLIENIYELSGTQFNINSPKQLREILFERLRLPVVKRSKTGPSTDEEVLNKLADKHKLPALLLEYRQLTKLKNTYVDTLPESIDKETGMLHASFNQTGTETGRLSSSNPNLQNIPVKTDIGRKIRQAFIASSRNNYLVSCDYSQIELRILAHISGDQNLTAAFKEDNDIHKATASLIYGVEEPDVADAMREMAKRVNFGIVYGLTSYGLSRDLKIPIEEAQGFIDAYFQRYPRVKDYIEEQIKKAEKDGYVTTILGRRRYIPEIKNKNQTIRQFAQRQAVNAPIQGSASDLIKLAMIHIHRQIQEKGLGSRMVMQIHDELVFDVPAEEIRELTEMVRERMENVLELGVPVKVKIQKGKNWLDMEEER
jgi:DNA polymerase-1